MDDLGQVEERTPSIRRHFSRVNNGLLLTFPKSGNSTLNGAEPCA